MVLAAPAFLLGAGAQASDLAGSCCADLEERIAELEATTARKGNRKVSLTISGYVTKQIMFWDDGAEQNAYISDIGPTQATNFRFSGEATIAPGWKAGYLMRIQDLSDNSMGLSQTTSQVDQGLNVQMSYWYLASKELGKVSVGKNALASKSAAMFTDLSGTQIIANYVLFDGGSFFLRSNGTLLESHAGATWATAIPSSGRGAAIATASSWTGYATTARRSPVSRFRRAGAWTTIGRSPARYPGELAGFKIALGAGYSNNTDESTQPPPVSFHKDSSFFQAGGYVEHLATGLFVHAAYGREDNNGEVTFAGFTEPDTHQWYVKGGVRRQWTSLGHTIVYGEFAEYFDQLSPAALAAGATSSEFTRWGFGAVQEIDAASMSLWVKYRQHQADITGAGLGDIEDFRYVSTGALINF